MPNYEFKCEECEHTFEKNLPVRSRDLKTCPECRAKALTRLITGCATIFKGKGWTPRFHGDKK
jgi:putative FmdB family regulatory protein